MPALTIDPTGRTVLRDGEPLPIVADTAWASFSEPTAEEWSHYLRRRRRQGFTAVLISTLPILNDRTEWAGERHPYALDAEGHYDWDRPDESYWAQARAFTAAVVAEGMVPMLVVLWCCYIEGTWAHGRVGWSAMPDDARRAHVARIARDFSEYDPILVVSGDDDFRHEHAVSVWTETLAAVAELAPGCLTTMHSTPTTVLPPVIADSADLDLYIYQSGHDERVPERTWELAAQYLDHAVRRPIVNIEPPYEQHGWAGTGTGRWTREQVRQLTWWSIVGGASAGLGYGAHGVWQWHRREGRFTSPEFSLEPFPWQDALAFPGGDDVSLTVELLRRHGMHRLEPAQQLLDAPLPTTRAGASPDGDLVVVYLGAAREQRLAVETSGFRVHAWDLDARTPVVVELEPLDGGTVLRQLEVLGDAVVVLER